MSRRAKKNWSGESIRELARARLRAAEGGQKPENIVTPAAVQDELAPDFVFSVFDVATANRAFLVFEEDDVDEGDEITELCLTLGMHITQKFTFRRRGKVDPATYLGRGQIAKIRDRMTLTGAQVLVLDVALSPAQVRNLENALRAPVLDRQATILAIFKSHARSSLAKLQVELAQLKFLQPRLSGLWQGLSRQRGGRGGLGGRGLGESRLELDRRVIKRRISQLTAKLEKAERVYETQARKRADFPRVALVGYTNAGKSTFMQRLTQTEALSEDKLFSTLDTTVRVLQPPTHPKILVSDTVGFVRQLPHELVASFKSTLREACDSQLLLHVVDASHDMWREQFASTEAVLAEIGASNIPRVLLFNKVDKTGPFVRMRMAELKRMLLKIPQYERAVLCSAVAGIGLDEIRQVVLDFFKAEEKRYDRAQPREKRTARLSAE